MSLTILRKRYIPFETIDISGDEVLFRSEDLLITRWKAIKPRNDISGGISWAFLKNGYKISKFYNKAGEFGYWYCDIIDAEYDLESDKYTLIDLLVDIRIMPDGKVEILDADELADALEQGLVTREQTCRSLRNLNSLLDMIYSGNFPPAICEEYNEAKKCPPLL